MSRDPDDGQQTLDPETTGEEVDEKSRRINVSDGSFRISRKFWTENVSRKRLERKDIGTDWTL